MSNDRHPRRVTSVIAAAAIVVGLGAGSYGIANAASGSGTTGATGATGAAAPSAQNPWGRQRSDETLLTGDTAAKVRAAALAKLSGATIVRVETDADGHAKYEAHVVQADGTPATVYVDADFNVVSVETR